MDPERRAVNTLDDADAHVRSLLLNLELLSTRVRTLEKQVDTHGTPWWRRVLFRIDGWPAWWVVADEPAWRPWRRWWRS